MSKRPLSVGFLWHMHQPLYTEPDSGLAIMPWTRLHATKDYADMPLWCEENNFPATFNLVPCLLDQLVGYADGSIEDIHLRVSKIPIDELTPDDRAFIVGNFFAANERTMIKRFPRYWELYQKRGPVSSVDSARMARLFDNQEILDLTVLHNLAWFGEHLKKDPDIEKMIFRGRDFTEENRRLVIDKSLEWIRRIIPIYKRLWDENVIELTMSPYYHPILPLLCKTSSGRDADPTTILPSEEMFNTEDAYEQINRGIERFEEIFGRKPSGMWPSEGSVSEDIIPILNKTCIDWIVTDEAILHKSLTMSSGDRRGRFRTDTLYRPYKIMRKGKELNLIFRDRRLSDRIGFDFAGLETKEAVDDFIGNLKRIHQGLPDDGVDYIVPVVLDGENAWEYFAENGREFLSELYSRLNEDESIKPITIGGFIEENPDGIILERLATGSWINGEFKTWIGSPEKNRAWDELIRTHRAYIGTMNLLDRETAESAYKDLLIAEGSDWFWWYGEGNYTQQMDEFDTLFRERLKTIYKKIGLPSPDNIDEPIYTGNPVRKPVRPPLELFTPSLDGRSTNYYEWAVAGLYEPTGSFGPTYCRKSERIIDRLFFGFDKSHLYLRIDTSIPARNLMAGSESVAVEFSGDVRYRFVLTPGIEGPIALFQEYIATTAQWRNKESGIAFAADEVIEMRIPFVALNAEPDTERKFHAYVFRGNNIEERFPISGYLVTPVPGVDFEENLWTV